MNSRRDAVDAWEALYRAQVAVLRHIRSEFPEGVTFTDYDVLFNLSRQPGRRSRIRDLNKHLLLSQPSVSRLVDRLAARGLVAKASDPDDARGTVVELTQAGWELFRRAGIQHSRVIAERMSSALTDEELAELARLTNKLRQGEEPAGPEGAGRA
ncbi:MarR family winged helix-turn-helix transcriptional regulator [Homoserinibacter sp. YIM 151385]|uniref:MarR family winged helix-turn-helix transcriptional regulator n=1 Tax=Homoserinibacter sp. YIM 151385 TaxID=2985506 RepID=UPI0022F048A1|nr:MarR family transcriptional regulator [Homoserinibacter sp. YIM 151385]WBU37043.1 MarR family transcriptional regulator [Homoserinibacter sp. YIM 151385]